MDMDWADALPYVLTIYNHSPHSGTGLSPFEALTGRPPRHPHVSEDFMRLFPFAPQRPPTATKSLLRPQLATRFGTLAEADAAWGDAEQVWKEHLELHSNNLVRAANLRRDIRLRRDNRERLKPHFRPGLKIWIKDVLRPVGADGKLSPKRTRPWTITAVDDDAHSLVVAYEHGDPLPRSVPFEHARIWTRLP